MYDKMVIRPIGIRNMYREGINRFGEVLNRSVELENRMEHRDALIGQLIAGRLRTEQALLRTEQKINDLAEDLHESHLQTEQKIREVSEDLRASHLKNESVVRGLAESVKAFLESAQKRPSD